MATSRTRRDDLTAVLCSASLAPPPARAPPLCWSGLHFHSGLSPSYRASRSAPRSYLGAPEPHQEKGARSMGSFQPRDARYFPPGWRSVSAGVAGTSLLQGFQHGFRQRVVNCACPRARPRARPCARISGVNFLRPRARVRGPRRDYRVVGKKDFVDLFRNLCTWGPSASRGACAVRIRCSSVS